MSKTQEQIDRATMGCIIRAITDWTPKPGNTIRGFDGVDYTIEQRHLDMAETFLINQRTERLAKLDAKVAG
jgi:hypothetical protein